MLTKAIVTSMEAKTAAMLKEEGVEKRHITRIQEIIRVAVEKIKPGEHSLENHSAAPTMIGLWNNSTMLQVRKILMEEAKQNEKQAWQKIDKLTIVFRDTATEVNKQIASHGAGLTEDIKEAEKAEQVRKAWEVEKN